jgi:hypothetical protein
MPGPPSATASTWRLELDPSLLCPDIVSQVTGNVSRRGRKLDSVLGHCLLRAFVGTQGGLDGAVEAWGANGERMSKWTALKTAGKVTPLASRVAAFIVMWAVAMRDEGRGAYSITEYRRYWNEGERQAYRLQKEFRELWPEYETPNELAQQIVMHIDGRVARKDVALLPLALRVTA